MSLQEPPKILAVLERLPFGQGLIKVRFSADPPPDHLVFGMDASLTDEELIATYQKELDEMYERLLALEAE